jgi:hypothetical protein
MMIELAPKVNRAFSAGVLGFTNPWGALPQARVDAAPLALNTHTHLHAPAKPICLQHFSFTYSILKFSS